MATSSPPPRLSWPPSHELTKEAFETVELEKVRGAKKVACTLRTKSGAWAMGEWNGRAWDWRDQGTGTSRKRKA